jgi:hypothetical protein
VDNLCEKLRFNYQFMTGETCDISERVARCFPAEVFHVEDGKATWMSRPSFSWMVELPDGDFLGSLMVMNKAFVTRSRPLSKSPLFDRVGNSYQVIGDSRAKIAQLTDGIAAAERLPSLRTDYRARVDRHATAESQIAHRAEEEVRFLNYVENKGTLRARGSPQSSLLSFEVLNILSAFAVTKEGMEVTKNMMMTQPGVFLLCGVPAFVLERIRGMQRPCREPLNALVHGDDRHTVNQEEEESFLTPCGVVAINRCPISNKSESHVLINTHMALCRLSPPTPSIFMMFMW